MSKTKLAIFQVPWSSTLKHFRNLSFGRIVTYFESCGLLRIYVLRNSSQSKKLKGNLPIGQLVSHTSEKATIAYRRKEFSCSCRKLQWKAHGVGPTVISTNSHSIGSDCHWLFISGHEEITSDYRWYYPQGYQERMPHVTPHVGETSVKLYSYDVLICHIWGTYQRILAFPRSVCASHQTQKRLFSPSNAMWFKKNSLPDERIPR